MDGVIEEKSTEIIRKIWTNPAFKQELIGDPRGVIIREFGVELPAATEVTVLEDSTDTAHLVLVDPGDLPASQRTAPRGVLAAKAWGDPLFKEALLADPKAAVATLGVELPAGFNLTVVEQTDNAFYIVIPARPAALSDADLDKVAGGTGFFKEVWNITKQQGIDQYNDAKNAVENEFWYNTSGSSFALVDQLAYHGGKYAGKEIVKGAKSIGHAAKKVFHGW